MEGGGEDEELREEAGKRRDTCQGEQGQGHEEGQFRVGAVEAVVLVELELVRTDGYDGDDGEHAEVRKEVDEYIVDQGGHTLGGAADGTQQDVARLRDAGEGHEAFQVFLTHREEVGQGDGGDDDPVEGFLPLADQGGEDFKEEGRQHEGGRAFGHDAEVGSHRTRSALVHVGCPQVEGHQGNLKAHAGEEEYEAHDLQGFGPEQGGYVAEIEGAGGTVNQGDTVEQQSAGEEGAEDVFGAGFGGVVAVFVERYQGSHRDAGGFQADEEQQEVAGGYHEVHAQQRAEGEEVELALLDAGVGQFHPFVRHQEDDEGTDAEDGLHNVLDGGVVVHAAEGFGHRTRHQGDDGVQGEQGYGQQGVEHGAAVVFMRVGAHEEVGDEEDQGDQYQRELFFHDEELGIIHRVLFFEMGK